MMDDGREVIGAFLRYRGHSLNSTDPQQLAKAKADCGPGQEAAQGLPLGAGEGPAHLGRRVDLAALERRHHPGQGGAAESRLRDSQGRVHHLGRLDVRSQERPEQARRARVDELHPAARGGRRPVRRHRLRHAERRRRRSCSRRRCPIRPRTSSSGWSTRWIWAATPRPGTRSGRRSSRREPSLERRGPGAQPAVPRADRGPGAVARGEARLHRGDGGGVRAPREPRLHRVPEVGDRGGPVRGARVVGPGLDPAATCSAGSTSTASAATGSSAPG